MVTAAMAATMEKMTEKGIVTERRGITLPEDMLEAAKSVEIRKLTRRKVVDDQSRAYAWGGNEYGQCSEEPSKDDTGRPLRRDIVIPKCCAPKLTVRQVFPFNRRKQISVPVRVHGVQNVCQIAVGAFHNLALKEDGTFWTWVNNEYGQLGAGYTQLRSHPIPVQGLDDLTLVYGWGRGEHGRLGFGDNDKSSKMLPQKVNLLAGEDIIQVKKCKPSVSLIFFIEIIIDMSKAQCGNKSKSGFVCKSMKSIASQF
ncbi:unnamed protein product [Thlaspi arvense]|uniref:Uncharacterized protein n=1 Tax=Thlaspi arvense TaxID=13288 RepID=A0AAU9SH27_THLAR|nr:unnamed protein product [Thlaspi arvense]